MYPMKLAPLVTPIVDGEARLLRMTPCRIHPARDRQIPTRPAVSILGSLIPQTIILAGLSLSVSAETTSPRLYFMVPMDKQTKMEKTQSNPMVKMKMTLHASFRLQTSDFIETLHCLIYDNSGLKEFMPVRMADAQFLALESLH